MQSFPSTRKLTDAMKTMNTIEGLADVFFSEVPSSLQPRSKKEKNWL